MTRLQVMSDLHLEFHADRGREFLHGLESRDVDVLVVAGDLCTEPLLDAALTDLCETFQHVVFVAGNHEYYQSSPTIVHRTLREIDSRLPGLHVLHNSATVIDGIRIAGTTLWFPRRPEAAEYRRFMNDFSYIDDFEPWVYEEHAAGVAFLGSELGHADVFVTHHLPSHLCVHKKYRGSPLSPFFVSEVGELLERSDGPALWIHGHTHEGVDIDVAGTRVLCNPRGYPGEAGGRFDERLIARVDRRARADSP